MYRCFQARATHATIEVWLETVFYTRSVTKGYKEDNWSKNADYWKGSAIMRRLEDGSRGIVIVRTPYPATSSEDTAGYNIPSVCTSDL